MWSRSIFNDPVIYARACALARDGLGRNRLAAQLGSSVDAARDFLTRWRLYGDDGAMTSGAKKSFTQQQKIDAVEMFLAGSTQAEVAEAFGISSRSVLKAWVRIYREQGPEGLAPKKRGRKPGSIPHVRSTEEKLQAENQRLRAEVAYLKALAAVEALDQPHGGTKHKPSTS